MTDTSRKAVERDVCGPIISYVDSGSMMSEKTLSGILDTVRTLVKERDAMSSTLAFLASRAGDLSSDTIETLARQALRNIGE
jgi:phage-related minor tail protein